MEALQKYGGTLEIRRDALQSLLHSEGNVTIQRVRLVYEGGNLKPTDSGKLNAAVEAARRQVPGVEILVQ